jgi:hypothetical protein
MTKIKLPKTLAECADALYKTRAKRLAFAKQLEAFKALEGALREHLIAQLPKGKASGISGKVARATIEVVPIPVISDFDEFMKHVSKTKGYDLVQRRINEAAVKLRWENNKTVPGIGRFMDKRVSLEKL